MWALLLSFSSNVLIDQVTAVIKGTHGPHKSSKEWKAWRDHRGAHLQVRREEVCVFMCGLKWECVCVCTNPHVNDSTLTCRCVMQVCVCECVRTSRGESTTRDQWSHATLQHLAADCKAAANKWARCVGRPPPNPLRERLSFWTLA